MILRIPIFAIALWVAVLPMRAADYNAIVLEQIRAMPVGGGYSTASPASENLRSAVRATPTGLEVRAGGATPSYCSGATYLVFLKTIGALLSRGELSLPAAAIAGLPPTKQADGEGVWGRWNANGPGAARLFHELGLGRNFTGFSEARPGDFLKIFWTDEVGANEHGHLVVFLGLEDRAGVPSVRFWSSNKPGGFGEKTVPHSKIARAIFSRLEHPERLAGVVALPARDAYLAGLLTRRSSFVEASEKVGAR